MCAVGLSGLFSSQWPVMALWRMTRCCRAAGPFDKGLVVGASEPHRRLLVQLGGRAFEVAADVLHALIPSHPAREVVIAMLRWQGSA